MKQIVLISLFSICFLTISFSQEIRYISEKEKETISIYTFDEDFALEGESIYENSCISCHGNPGQSDFTIMVPPPGDIASKDMQNKKDGFLYYKIKYGQGSMPSFDDAYSSEEIWNLVAYIRSFNPVYVQPVPNLEGIVIPKFALEFDFDDNVDKLVVKVTEDSLPVENAMVSGYVKSMFGKYLLGKSKTNKLGIAYFDVDYKIPGDSEGYLNILAKVSKGYGSAKKTEKMLIANPTKLKSAIEGKHLWSKDNEAPTWLRIFFFASIIAVWGTIFFVVFGLKKIRKFS